MTKLNVIQNNAPWYAEGLNFECTGCGQCCTGFPGYVWVSEEEIEKIAEFLHLSIEEFSQNYLRLVKGHLSLLELPESFDCIFLKEKKCQIYPVRPTQCRTFPWWPKNIKSKEDWQNAARSCEGIRAHAAHVSLETIEKQRLLQKEAYFHDT